MNHTSKNSYDNLNIKKLNSDGIMALSNRVKEEMAKNNFSIKELSKLTNINQTTIKKWYYDNDYNEEVDLDVLATICYVLYKKINDFLK